MQYFSMAGLAKRGKFGKLSTEIGFDVYSLWDAIESAVRLEEWTTLRFIADGPLSDYPPSNAIGRICSKKLVDIFNSFTTDIIWLPINVKDEQFFFMHFSDFPDVLNESKTKYLDGDPIVICIDLKKAGGMPVFAADALDPTVFVREDVKIRIEESGCTGIEFEKVKAS